MTSTERIEKKIADMKHQMGIMPKEKTEPERSGFLGLTITFIIGFILGMVIGYVIFA
jgi:tetrahydromethanopterin S-methyltransferase subunit F